MADSTIRVGIVGAGGNARLTHISGLQAMKGVEIVSVSNRSRESSERVAREFGIPKVYDSWLDLVRASDIDAICIGTWPNTHCAITLAALEADKHVLCEARMSMDAQQAHAMLDASRSKPHLVTQLVPSLATFAVDNLVMGSIHGDYLGDLLAVSLRTLPYSVEPPAGFINYEAHMPHWRRDQDVVGYNVASMGMWYESLIHWIGPATRVMASSRVFVNQLRTPDGSWRAVQRPDHVDVVCDMACGAQAHIGFSAVTGLAPSNEIWLFGNEGTLHIESDRVSAGKRGETELKEIPNPEEKRYKWRVEEEFVRAIRGEEQVARTPFWMGVQYMEFTEAVHRSAQTGHAVPLPL